MSRRVCFERGAHATENLRRFGGRGGKVRPSTVCSAPGAGQAPEEPNRFCGPVKQGGCCPATASSRSHGGLSARAGATRQGLRVSDARCEPTGAFRGAREVRPPRTSARREHRWLVQRSRKLVSRVEKPRAHQGRRVGIQRLATRCPDPDPGPPRAAASTPSRGRRRPRCQVRPRRIREFSRRPATPASIRFGSPVLRAVRDRLHWRGTERCLRRTRDTSCVEPA
jgi:hypothetical protein